MDKTENTTNHTTKLEGHYDAHVRRTLKTHQTSPTTNNQKEKSLKTARSKTTQIWFQVCDQETNSKTFPSDHKTSLMIQHLHLHDLSWLKDRIFRYLMGYVTCQVNLCCMPNWQWIVCIWDVGSYVTDPGTTVATDGRQQEDTGTDLRYLIII